VISENTRRRSDRGSYGSWRQSRNTCTIRLCPTRARLAGPWVFPIWSPKSQGASFGKIAKIRWVICNLAADGLPGRLAAFPHSSRASPASHLPGTAGHDWWVRVLALMVSSLLSEAAGPGSRRQASDWGSSLCPMLPESRGGEVTSGGRGVSPDRPVCPAIEVI
jgi:hypothetical protein